MSSVLRELRTTERRDGTLVARVQEPELASIVTALAGSEARFADLFGTPEENGITGRLIYGLDGEQRYLVVEAPLTDEGHPPLSDAEPAAFVEECELFEQVGIRPSGDKPLNRVFMPPNAEGNFPLLGGGSRRAVPRELRAPHHVRGEAFEFPFGPVRVAGWESLYMGLVTTGEEVLDLYLFHWHKHRGVERRLRGLGPARALFLVERTEGLSAVANGTAYCRAVEAAASVDPPAAAASTRAIAVELERIYNHAQAIAILCQTTGLSVGQAQAEIALEQLLRVNLATFGHRYLFGVVAVGGVSRAPDHDALSRLLPPAVDELRKAVRALLRTNSHVDRLEACGIVNEEIARRMALVGPVARASGIDLDTRRDHPWPGGASQTTPAVPVRQAGDALSRMEVMVAEVEESQRLILDLLPEAGDGTVEVPAGSGSGLGSAESPRGETLAYVCLGADGRIARARLRPAAARNWRAFDDAVRARNVFTDIPIIEASFWQTVAGFAR